MQGYNTFNNAIASEHEHEWSSLIGLSLPSFLHTIPTDPSNSDRSTADTIALMEQHSSRDARSSQVQEIVEEIREENPGASESDLISAVFDYVKSKITYVEDEETTNKLFGIPAGVELLISPARLVSMNQPMGDCDDFSMLTKSVLSGLGIRSYFTTVAAERDNPSKWSHVYVSAYTKDGKVIPIDGSHGKYVGWEAPNVTRKKVWGVTQQTNGSEQKGEEGMQALAGLGDWIGDDGNVYQDNTGVLASSGVNWGAILAPLTQTGSKIALAQFGQPQLAPNTYIRSPNGAILTNQPIGYGNFSAGGGIGSSGLLIGAIVVVGLLMVMGKH